MGTLTKTYPWLDFGLDLRKFSHGLWMKIGEAASKCEHVAGVPLDPEVAQRMTSVYLAKGALATTAIEGNTLSEDQAEGIIDGKIVLPPSQKYLEDEIKTIVAAFNEVVQDVESCDGPIISIEKIHLMNKWVLGELEVGEDVVPGAIRHHRVRVGHYSCPDPKHCFDLLSEFVEKFNNFPLPDESKTAFSIIKAIWAHLNLVWIHPYADGNGRTARLLELHTLLSSGLSAPVGHLLSNHYNKTRSRYYEKLESARKHDNGVIEFIEYSIEGFIDGLKEQIEYIKNEQWNIAWVNYVHKSFHGKESPADRRRKNLVLALSKVSSPVPMNKIRTIDSDTTMAYQGKETKTISRDVNYLVEESLLIKTDGKVRANKLAMIAFLPWRKREES